MNATHPAEAPPLTNGAYNAEGARTKLIQGMAGTCGGLALHIFQFSFALAAVYIMPLTGDFFPTTSFRFVIAAVALQSLWSLSLTIVDIYVLLVRRHMQHSHIVGLFTIGDGITSTLTMAAACASAGIVIFVRSDLGYCNKKNNCVTAETATTMAFISWFTTSPSVLLNFWWLASQRMAK